MFIIYKTNFLDKEGVLRFTFYAFMVDGVLLPDCNCFMSTSLPRTEILCFANLSFRTLLNVGVFLFQ